MSAFLGKIHYWLYNKILLHENLIESIAEISDNNGYNAQELIEQSYRKFGYPVTGELETEIEHLNIHGWLQERIISVEKRLAYVITELLNKNVVSKNDIENIFKQNAQHIAKQVEIYDGTPQNMFSLVFDYMLEGMPCDQVNEIIESTNNNISWETLHCLHKDYWDEAGGDINNFYHFRGCWINGFLEASGANYRYDRSGAISTIKRV